MRILVFFSLSIVTVLGGCYAADSSPARSMDPEEAAGTMATSSTTSAAGSPAAPAPAPTPSAPTEGPADAGVAEQGDVTPTTDAGCTVADTRVETCPLPQSTCVDETTLVFFENPRCEDGHCTADQKLMRCQSGPCQNDSCHINVTAL